MDSAIIFSYFALFVSWGVSSKHGTVGGQEVLDIILPWLQGTPVPSLEAFLKRRKVLIRVSKIFGKMSMGVFLAIIIPRWLPIPEFLAQPHHWLENHALHLWGAWFVGLTLIFMSMVKVPLENIHRELPEDKKEAFRNFMKSRHSSALVRSELAAEVTLTAPRSTLHSISSGQNPQAATSGQLSGWMKKPIQFLMTKAYGFVCKTCGKSLAFDVIKPDSAGAFFCVHCGESLNLRTLFQESALHRHKMKKGKVPCPSTIRFINESGQKILTKNTGIPKLLAVFGVAFSSFICWQVNREVLTSQASFTVVNYVFMIVAAIMIGVLIYHLEVTRIVLKNGSLKILVTSPMRLSQRTVASSDIENIITDMKQVRAGNTLRIQIYVSAYLKSGAVEKLIEVNSVDEALYLESVIEQHLGIADRTDLDILIAKPFNS